MLRTCKNFARFDIRKLLEEIDYNDVVGYAKHDYLDRRLHRVQLAAAGFATGKFALVCSERKVILWAVGVELYSHVNTFVGFMHGYIF